LNLFGLSPGELLLILVVAMIVIGPEKLPETAASIGKWIREFRRVTNELTQQFAEDNPFTEIQRALSFTDEPVTTSTPAYTPIQTTPASDHVAIVESPATVAQPAPAALSPARRTDYFDRPAYYPAIDDSWTHGGLAGYDTRQSKNGVATLPPIADEWAHGVAIPPPPRPVEVVESTVSQGEAGMDAALPVAVSTNPIETDAGEVNTDSLASGSIAGEEATTVQPPSESSASDVGAKPVEPPTNLLEPVAVEGATRQVEVMQEEPNGVNHHTESNVTVAIESTLTTAEPEAIGVAAGESEERLP
jgi:sec-independent protein translocase protein TatB